MSSNDFAKQVVIAFEEEVVPKFEDLLVLSKKVSIAPTDGTQMERAGDVIWRPIPYVAVSNDGLDATNDFNPMTDQVVPATLGFQKHIARTMDVKELRDLLRQKRFGEAAARRLASDVNIAVMDTVCNQATLIDTKTSAATGFVDPARLDSIFNRNGIPMDGRQLGYCTPDYNGLAADLAARQTMTGKPTTAYEKALIGENVSGFTAHKLDYANICPLATASGLTMSTLTAAGNFYTPKSKRAAATGEQANVDNRFHQITLSANTNINAGDMITFANVFEAHMITKRSTGVLRTFRVISKDAGAQITISPPIISNQGGTQAEIDYQNCVITAQAGNAALVFLNTAAKPMNPFWVQDAVELLPGRYEVPEGEGLKVSMATTANGIQIVMTEGLDINTLKKKFRWDIFFGVCVLRPDMVGVQLFNQV